MTEALIKVELSTAKMYLWPLLEMRKGSIQLTPREALLPGCLHRTSAMLTRPVW